MSGISVWLDLMPDTVTVEPYSSQNKYGEESYGAAVSYRARCVGKVVKVTDMNGNERVSTVTTYLNAAPTSLTVRDRITLPSRFTVTTPEILAIGLVPDESGHHHAVVYT